ncbi:MAG: TonB-dependent receptor plug domain-containing protein [Burkholderiales bacterium]|nr:TonB-dependent receptor plug domain-containing protein [Burkholderiales bacterium]
MRTGAAISKKSCKIFPFRLRRGALALALAAAFDLAQAQEPTVLPEVEVTAAPGLLLGEAAAASEGTVTQREIVSRPSIRPADVLELVPGMIVTQHSGAGKANQYFLRGFNLDHGTDFSARVAGMPVNMPTHAHGQGYLDLNFLIPELVRRMDYRKGPYYADVGDFSSAGSVSIDYFRTLPENFGQLEYGNYGYRRAVVAASPRLGPGTLLAAGELFHDDGPWEVPQDYKKLNGVLSYSAGTLANGWAITAMGYSGKWNATDQVPLRALESGLIGRFGTLDASDGGETWRYSLSGQWTRSDATSATAANAYFVSYGLDLWSNFTYFLNDPVNGDQFRQSDRRKIGGLDLAQRWQGRWNAIEYENAIGFSGRYDRINPVTLALTRERQDLTLVREDKVNQTSAALWAQNDTRWTPWARTVLGLRAEQFWFDVTSNLPENSGRESAGKVLPKATLVLGPWARTELYANWGQGYHSNDARGVMTRINPDPRDPGYLQPVTPVTPLAKTTGYEVGLRSAPGFGFQTTLALWRPDIDSELLRRRRHHRAEPAEPPGGGRVVRLLVAAPVARVRPPLRLHEGALHRRRPGRRPSPRRDRAGRERRRDALPLERLLREPALPLLRLAAARRGQLRALVVLAHLEPARRLPVHEELAARPRRDQPLRP